VKGISLASSFQNTLAGPAVLSGVGVHTGAQVRVAIGPGACGTGVVFVRTDIDDRDSRIPARGEAVVQTRLGTVLGNAAGVTVSTVEHLMAAFHALGVDNAVVEVDGPEMPIMDGSAQAFVAAIEEAGLTAQDAPRQYIEILERVEAIEGEARASLAPADRFELSFEIDFASAAIGRQRVELAVDEASFRDELADNRTFGFLHEVEMLRQMGLARGGSLDNTLVFDGDALINEEGQRRPDEPVRHKAIDAIGDLYLLGAPVIGRYEGIKAGHGVNNALVRAVLARPEAWRLRTADGVTGTGYLSPS
jgi:UDP-3-O-[3-hydroxymyristoyl] N-acetylglucosamine deacetylase